MNNLLNTEEIRDSIVDNENYRVLQENDIANTYNSSRILVTHFIKDNEIYINPLVEIREVFSRRNRLLIKRINSMQNHCTDFKFVIKEKQATISISSSRFIPKEIIEINTFDGNNIMGLIQRDGKYIYLRFIANKKDVLDRINICECTPERILNFIRDKYLLGPHKDEEILGTYNLLFDAGKNGLLLVMEEYVNSLINYITKVRDESENKAKEIDALIRNYAISSKENHDLADELSSQLKDLYAAMKDNKSHNNRK